MLDFVLYPCKQLILEIFLIIFNNDYIYIYHYYPTYSSNQQGVGESVWHKSSIKKHDFIFCTIFQLCTMNGEI